MPSLFEDMGRSERQELGVQKWIDSRLRGSFVYCTGFGKTRTALMCITRFLAKNPDKKVLIVVPTDPLKRQWMTQLAERDLLDNCQVQIINTVVTREWSVDFLVLDEVHKYASNMFSQVFTKVKYKIILGLTATMSRLDGKEKLIETYCPVIDTVTVGEATSKGWLSPYREYKVFINTDLTEYNQVNKEFYEHFSFFNHDFNLAMSCRTSWQARAKLAKERTVGNPSAFKDVNKQILIHAMGFKRTLDARKAFIDNHPKKIELANLILEHRQDKKCVTFSKTIKMAERIKYGKVLSSKDTKKKGRITLEEFIDMDTGVLNTSKMLDEGADIPGLSVAVILGYDSSPTRKTQRIGRVIRKAENKTAEVFTFVIKGTVEEAWFDKSTGGKDYITINDDNLQDLLEGNEFTVKVNKLSNMLFTA